MQSRWQFCSTALMRLLTLSVACLLLGTPLWVSAAESRGGEAAEASAPKADYLKRHALVIGNATYQKGPLANPVNDARAMQSALTRSGFDVIALENASRAQMMEAVAKFGDRLRDGGVGLFYYAGHGIQLKGRNFLIPVDAAIAREEEVQYKAVDAGEVLDTLGSAKNPLNIIILDACRSNPFPRSSRGAEMGLASMDAPVGALIAFATGPNAVALDGQGKNGLYTEHLLKYITQPGLRVEDVFKRVRMDVRQATNNAQIPWESTSLEGDFYFVPNAAGPTQTSKGKPQPVDDKTLSLEFWSAIKTSSNVYDYQAYLNRFPTGEFAPLARQRVADLSKPPPPKEVKTASTFSFSRAEEEAAREWSKNHPDNKGVVCSSARKSVPIQAQIDERLLTGMSNMGGLAAEAIITKLRAAGLNIVTSAGAKYVLKGTVVSQANPNRRLALNDVSLNATVTLSDASGIPLSSALHREESYAGNDVYSVYAGLVSSQAAKIADQILRSDFCQAG
jgi:hypothetical protein